VSFNAFPTVFSQMTIYDVVSSIYQALGGGEMPEEATRRGTPRGSAP